jgi:septal ring factor EnvC (AmiA/AmiB activator)
MKKISLWFLIFAFTAAPAFAQETATQQQLDKLSGQIQELQEAQAQQGKRIDGMEKEISELRDKVNTSQVNDSASREDLKKLAAQMQEKVQEIDRKRQDDRDLILKEIEKLGKAAAIAPVPPTTHKTTSKPPADDPGTAAVPPNGYEYPIKDGDTLGLIVKAYRDKGVKVTKAQIIAANPKMNPNVLIPGKKIFIPDANAK